MTDEVDNITLSYGDWQTDAQALGWPSGIAISKQLAYIMANGFKQSMTDASAMTKEQKAKAHADAIAAGHDVTEAQAVEAKAHEQRAKRFADILAGTVGVGAGGPRLPQIDRVMREIAEEQVAAAVRANNDNAAKGLSKPNGVRYEVLSMPKGDNLKTLVEKRLSVAGDAIRLAAQSRIDAANSAVLDLGIDLG